LSNKKIISFQITQLRYLKKIVTLACTVCCCIHLAAQGPQFSLATDLTLQGSFKKEQRFWAVGHTTTLNFHLTPKNGVYVWFCYFSDGKFTNALTATARQPATIPQQINYDNNARLRFKHFSVGWKRYLKGTPDSEKGYNLYGFAGLGLMLGRVNNEHSVLMDTALYAVPVLSGKANFKRLTLDLGAGIEFPIGGEFNIYSEGKVFIPTTDYPSKYIFMNDKAPYTVMLSLGLRLLF
jgi:hypothetical protein